MRQSHPDSLHLGAVAAERIDNRPGQGRRSDCTAIQIGVQYGVQGCHVYIFSSFSRKLSSSFPTSAASVLSAVSTTGSGVFNNAATLRK